MRAWKQPSTDSCHVLQSLIFMMLGHMGETHTDGIPVQLINQICSIYISAHECYNFVFKGLIDQVILYSQAYIRKCNITALIFLRAPNVGAGLNLNGISM